MRRNRSCETIEHPTPRARTGGSPARLRTAASWSRTAARRLRAFAPWISTAALVGLGASGCGKSGSTAPPAAPASLTLNQALHAALPATITVPENLDTTASVLVTLHFPEGLKGAGAAFESGGQLVEAGAVWIRTTKLVGGGLDSVQFARTVTSSGGHTLIIYSTLATAPPSVVNIPFDGITFHVFRVTGSTSIPAFVDSVRSVDDLNLTAPAEADSVTRSAGLTVSWSDAGSDPTVMVGATVIAGSDSTLRAASDAASDPTGTLLVPAARLMALPAGAARVAVARYRLVYQPEGSLSIGFVCESVEVRNVTLK
ncbi:MAG: hypothetical protein HYR73_09860 [Candidatus Eisenbacteria bacterium]|nr:hypothetical protein [Candidatus Eisenbacteria bacterium]